MEHASFSERNSAMHLGFNLFPLETEAVPRDTTKEYRGSTDVLWDPG